MPITTSNPEGVHKPASRYSHAALVTGGGRRLAISGQIGMTADGEVPDTSAAQMDVALANIGIILKAHGMAPSNLVRLNVFLLNAECIKVWRVRREEFLAGHAPASTLLLVSGLADPRLMVEIEAEAAD